MKSRGVVAVLVMVLLTGVGWGQRLDTDHDSLPPWIEYYNKLKGEPKLVPFYPDFSEPESLNMRLVGKWGRGPAARVTGRDSLVYVSMGSEVCVFNCADASNPRVISEIQCRYVVDKAILKDTFLYAVLQGGVEVFNIANPRSVTRIRYLNISAVDMCIEDSLAYTIDADSFKVYKLVRPDSFQRLGACADSGYYLAVSQGFGYACDRWGLYVIDATNPASPHQVSTMSPGTQTGAVLVESTFCYYTEIYPSTALVVASVVDQAHPSELGRRPWSGGGDICKSSFFVYLPWSPGYQIVDVSQPGNPTLVSSLNLGGYQNSVWTRSAYTYSFVADGYEGLAIISIADPVHPLEDTVVGSADNSYDVAANAAWVYIANYYAGMKVLTCSIPSTPLQVGSYDTIGQGPEAQAVGLTDSFACLMTSVWRPTDFRMVDVSQPVNPRLAAAAEVWNAGQAVAIRDSLVYVAENNYFEIFSIANPRSPRLVGSCRLPNISTDLWLEGTLAFISPELRIIDVADPAQPTLFNRIPGFVDCAIAVRDTLAYLACAGNQDSLAVWSVANPLAPYRIYSVPTKGLPWDIELAGSQVLVGCRYGLQVFDITDPVRPAEIGYYPTPDQARRVFFDGTYVYAACLSGGVCIFETVSTGIAEGNSDNMNRSASPQIDCWPNPAREVASIRLTGGDTSGGKCGLFDLSGRLVKDLRASGGLNARILHLNLTDVRPGVYFAIWRNKEAEAITKLIKR